jgi:hypothetical protein
VIDFRYHLVSLISVFLALAVGIVLGAGPLRGNLGTQLTGQVEQLRSEKDELRVDNTELTRQNEEMSAYVTATAPRLVAGTLSGTRTAVVYDSDTIGTPVDSVQSLLTEAGAEAGPTVRLEPDLWDPAKEDARADALTDLREIAPSLVTQAEEATADASSNSDTLGHLVAVLVVDPQLSADERGSAWDALIGAGLVNVSGRTDVASNAVVVAGATPDDLTVAADDSDQAAARTQAITQMQSRELQALADADVPTVVAGSTDRLQEADGPALAVLALAEQVEGGQGSYGTASGAGVRVPELTGETGDTDDSGGTSDGGEG